MPLVRRAVFAASLATIAGAASAQNTVIVGLGPQSAPEYFGSSENRVGVTGSFAVQELNFGPLSTGGSVGGTPEGFGYGGSFRFIGARDAADYPELTGLADIDAAVELGGRVSYSTDIAEIYGALRYGVTGHSSLVGELGGDVIARPTDQVTLRLGPRLFFADGDYAQTYFGVTADEAAANRRAGGTLVAYDAGGGFLSRGVEASAAYAFNDDWGVKGTVRYDEYVNDAGASPIVRQGSDTATTVSLVVTRRFSF